jgi:hypothetical protein
MRKHLLTVIAVTTLLGMLAGFIIALVNAIEGGA